jgi:hypothetical protein
MHLALKTFAKAIATLTGLILVFLGIKRYSRSEALLYSVNQFTQGIFTR